MAAADVPLIISILQILANSEPAIIQAIHNLLTGTGTADDLAILKADRIIWQTLADKASAEVAKITKTIPPPPQPPIIVVPPSQS